MTDTPATEPRYTVGVDLGGTNMRLAIYRDLPPRGGSHTPSELTPPVAIASRRTEVGSARTPAAVVEKLSRQIVELVAEAGPEPLLGEEPSRRIAVGIGIAGMLHGHTGMIANSPHLRWRDVQFGDLMRAALGEGFSVSVYNDVNAITYGEYAVGAGAGASDVLAVFVGTGVGAGIVAGDRLITGATNCGAEIGHVTVAWGDRAAPCACGLSGCVEAYVGGSYLERRVRAELTGGARSRAVALAGKPELVTLSHIDEAAATGDDYSLDLYVEIAPLLGVVLANAVTLLNPARLILGGGVLSRTPVLREHVIASVEVAVNPPALAGLTICEAALGDDAGLIGSALLASQDLEQ